MTIGPALSGLAASQRQIDIESKNLAGSLTPGYMKVSAQEYNLIQGGKGNGVQVGQEKRSLSVEDYFIVSNRDMTQQNACHQVLSNSLGKMTNVICRNDEDTNLPSLLQNIMNAYTGLSASSSSVESQTDVLRNIDNVCGFLNKASTNNLVLRKESEQNINLSVEIINTQLDKIKNLNNEIAGMYNQSTADLESQRDLELKILAEHVDFTIRPQPLEQLFIYSPKGRALLESEPSEITFPITQNLDYGSVYPQTANGLHLVDDSGNTVDITKDFTSGAIYGNFMMRDKEIPNIQAELDQLGGQLKDLINEINNLGVQTSPPSALVGLTSFVTNGANTVFQGQGIFRAAVLDNQGAMVGYSDLNLTQYNTIGAFMAALGQALQVIDGGATVQLVGGDQHLEITTITPNRGFGLTSVGDTAREITTGKNLAHYFGFNNLLMSKNENAPGLSSSLQTRGIAYLTHAKLVDVPAPTVGQMMVHKNDGSVINDMVDAFQQERAFDFAGNMGSRQQTLIQYAASLITELSTRTQLEQGAADGALRQKNESDVQLADVGGVSSMESLQNMLQQFNRYTACTKALEVHQKTFTALMAVI